jgi:type IV pilus assembly protein PilB
MSTLGQILVSRGYVTREQLDSALGAQRGLPTPEQLGDTLVNMGYLSQKDKWRCLAEQWGVEFVDLESFPVDPDIVKLVTQETCRRYKAIPVSRPNGKVVVAMTDPNNIYAIDALRLITGGDVEPVLAEEEDILGAISRFFADEGTAKDAVQNALKDINVEAIEVAQAGSDNPDDLSVAQLRELVDEAPVVRLANLILSQAVKDGASDIHVEPTKNGVRVRNRVDGILQETMSLPKKVQSALVSRVKIMASMDIAEKRAPQDGRISLLIDGKQWDFRVSTLPSAFGEKIVLRILDQSTISVGLHRLGILPKTMELFENVIQSTYGIILVTGPTGSGKSTTLYSVLSKLNSPEKNILTIEDPVEYELAGLTQVGMNKKAGLTFAAGLKCMLRQDPDIIMVGEIRDEETGTIAVEAALTGHLVLSTLHTNDAPGAVTRLLDMGVEPFLISSSVIGVLAQRLARVICPRCKVAYQPPMDAVRRLGITMESAQGVKFYRGRGCDHCKGKGYKGRTGIYELMVMNDEIRELCLQRASSHTVKEAAIRNGMLTLKADATEKVMLGVTTLEETLRVVYSG